MVKQEFSPTNTRLRTASARQARKDAKIQRTIAVNPNLFRVFGVFGGLKAWFSLLSSVRIFL
ncbi:MAG TPA: hypothetical protein VNY07_02465 [Chthoniobacterales bacterium]|jgi:hypothetical protein|nr:hypothetical protein [Chthoniobacterales bacterium]